MKMPSVMSHSFSQVPSANIQRSQFQRNHSHKTTMNASYLVPLFWDEVLPGDTFNVQATIFARMSTPLVPIMDNMYADTFYFFVPMRLVWENTKKFFGEQANPGDSTDFLMPEMTSSAGPAGYAEMSIFDYFGLPTKRPAYKHSSLWLRSYNKIWNEWFRDENLQDSVPVPMGDGPDTVSQFTLLQRGKRHDYFTSALPWPQKGPAVPLPITGSAPVYGQTTSTTDGSLYQFYGTDGTTRVSKVNSTESAVGSARNLFAPNSNVSTVTGQNMSLATKDQINLFGSTARPPLVDLTGVTLGTINQLRQAFQIQKFYERDARGGTRYTEIIRSHFGVVSPDARLQRPEYLGGSSAPINVSPVPQTSATDGGTPQGNLAATGTFAHTGSGFVKSFTEHGFLIGLLSIRADLSYQQGLPRMYSRRAKFDLYWPAFSHLGEQTILNKEIYLQGDSVTNSQGIIDNQVFGYQERYAEYRYKPSVITGLYRSNATASLDMWHLSEEFGNLPALNNSFITDSLFATIKRTMAVPSQPDFLVDSYFKVKTARPMPTYGVPGQIDRF